MTKPEAIIYALVVLASLVLLIISHSLRLAKAAREQQRRELKAIAQKEPEI